MHESNYQTKSKKPHKRVIAGISRRSGSEMLCMAKVQAAVDAKPEYHTLTGTVVLIDPQQAFYYQANPSNNRKVGLLEAWTKCS